MTIQAISQEIKTFEKNRKPLVEKAEGKFVLIRKDTVINIFDTENEAIKEGYSLFGNEPFLVKEILKEDRIATVGGS